MIRQITADEIPFDALLYLKKGLERSPGNDRTLAQLLEQSRNNQNLIFIVEHEKIDGAFCIELYPGLLNVFVLGGENISEWKDEIFDFLYNFAVERGITKGCVMGRTGWGRMFKKFKPLGTFYAIDGGGL